MNVRSHDSLSVKFTELWTKCQFVTRVISWSESGSFQIVTWMVREPSRAEGLQQSLCQTSTIISSFQFRVELTVKLNSVLFPPVQSIAQSPIELPSASSWETVTASSSNSENESDSLNTIRYPCVMLSLPSSTHSVRIVAETLFCCAVTRGERATMSINRMPNRLLRSEFSSDMVQPLLRLMLCSLFNPYAS